MGEVDLTADVVDLGVEQLGECLDRVAERRGGLLDVLVVTGVAGRAAPAELVLVGVSRPGADVERLDDAHVVDLAAHAGRDGREVVGEARIDAAAEQAGAARPRRPPRALRALPRRTRAR